MSVFSLLRSHSLVVCSLLLVACSNNPKLDDIYVDIGKPRHWTLDDAHYLLTDLHAKARDIEISAPSSIDPNELHSSRISQVERITDVALKYDELTAIKNEFKLEQLEDAKKTAEQATVRQEAISKDISALRSEILKTTQAEATVQAQIDSVTAEIKYFGDEASRYQTEIDNLPVPAEGENETEDVKNRRIELEAKIAEVDDQKRSRQLELEQLQAEKASLTTIKSAQNEQLAFLNTDLTTASQAPTATTVALETTQPDANRTTPATSALASTAFSSAISKALSSDELGIIPKLHASERIENYVEAENELLARKLSLMKRDIGETNDLIFLELPHSIVSASDESENRRVQIHWQVKSYCIGRPFDKVTDDNKADDIYGEIKSIIEGDDALKNLEIKTLQDYQDALFDNNDLYQKAACLEPDKIASADNIDFPTAWDLIPKSDAFNTAIYNLDDDQSFWGLTLGLLKGIGFDANYAERRQLYEQFASQDVFASAYGQGTKDFGWVLNPKPGTERVSSGAKTTFASVIVPNNASVLILKPTYCVLNEKQVAVSRSDFETKVCKTSSEDYAIILNRDKNFWVNKVEYDVVSGGGSSIVRVKGSEFSNHQLSVLIDGVPIKRVDEPLSHYPINAPVQQADKSGFQVLSSRDVIIKITKNAGYEGTPTITFVTPGKSLTLNNEHLIDPKEFHQLMDDYAQKGATFGVNTSTSQTEESDRKNSDLIPMSTLQSKIPMFQVAPTISGFELSTPVAQQVALTITGAGFYGNSHFKVNGTPIPAQIISSKRAELAVKEAPYYQITVENRTASTTQIAEFTTRSTPPDNALTISSIKTVDATQQGKIVTMELLLEGSGITDKLTVQDLSKKAESIEVFPVSSNTAYFRLSTAQNKTPLKITQLDASHIHILTTTSFPKISSIKNSVTGDSHGTEIGGEIVRISGENFDNVVEVTFGAATGNITGISSKELTVQAPKGKGKQVVLLRTKTMINDQFITNLQAGNVLYYEYKPVKKKK